VKSRDGERVKSWLHERELFSLLANLNIFSLFFLSFLHTLQSLIIQLLMKNIFKYWRIFLYESIFVFVSEWRRIMVRKSGLEGRGKALVSG
jgi:hypothetical protein